MAGDLLHAMRLGRERRVRFPQDEDRHPWLRSLLEAYALVDGGVALAVTARGETPACGPGCFNCCIQPVPATPFEVVGMEWYLKHKLALREQRIMAETLSLDRDGMRCPMLLEGRCVVHPLRPVVCRDFVVFGRACGLGEDPCVTRPGDVLRPVPEAVAEAYGLMLPYYGVTGHAQRREAVRSRYYLDKTLLVQNVDWRPVAGKLAEAMERTRPGRGHGSDVAVAG